MTIQLEELRTEFGLTRSETDGIERAMQREVEAGGGKWFRPTGTNNRLHRVITQQWVERRDRNISHDGFRRKKLIAAASVLLKRVLESNSTKGANAAE